MRGHGVRVWCVSPHDPLGKVHSLGPPLRRRALTARRTCEMIRFAVARTEMSLARGYGKAVEWMEKVSDEQSRAGAT
jgi:hypothetical protein